MIDNLLFIVYLDISLYEYVSFYQKAFIQNDK